MADETNKSILLPVDIEAEMKKSYLDYAMSVIIARALPDVRDGLKPVQCRILVAMPTAIPLAPFTSKFGIREGRTNGSSRV